MPGATTLAPSRISETVTKDRGQRQKDPEPWIVLVIRARRRNRTRDVDVSGGSMRKDEGERMKDDGGKERM
jgi:hypothetical protein